MKKRAFCLAVLWLLGMVGLCPRVGAEEETFLLSFVGDCTFGTDPHFSQLSSFPTLVGDDYDYPFRNVISYFQNDDFTMANLEGALADSGTADKQGFVFRGKTDYVNILTRGSVEAVTVANNHTRDYGEAGYASTLEALSGAGVTYVEGDACATFTTDRGLKLGLYACSLTMGLNQYQYGLNLEKMEENIAQMRQQGAELIIMAVHWGTEGSYYAIAEQTALAHRMIDLGVDIVYGSHPHVLQRIETYGGGIIYYSLGNFCFGGNHWPNDMDTAIIQQEVIRGEDGVLRLGQVTPIPASISSTGTGQNNFQPTPYAPDSQPYQRTMSKLF